MTAWPPAAPGTRIVDLTHPLVGQAPTYPGQPASLFQERIIEAGFGLVGLDFGSPDETGRLTEPCHHALLGADVLIIENLNGLDGVDAGWCWFCAAPLLTGGGDGGFCRTFAAVPS